MLLVTNACPYDVTTKMFATFTQHNKYTADVGYNQNATKYLKNGIRTCIAKHLLSLLLDHIKKFKILL